MELYTPLEVAKKMGVAKFTPYGWIKAGKLKAIDVSQSGIKKARWVIREDDFNEFKTKYENDIKEHKSNTSDNVFILQELAKMKVQLLELAVTIEDLENKLTK